MIPSETKKIEGTAALETLAETYQQLYIAPGEDGEAQYAEIVRKGKDAEIKTLSHFRMNEKDCLEYEDTPAGKVLCLTLNERSDFVTFLRIMANRCSMAEIPDTQGASILNGIINWQKIYAHEKAFLEEAQKAGDPSPDWNAEFKRFTSDKRNFKDALIVLSVGPYSAIPSSAIGVTDPEWITMSHTIRKYHECTHFICRNLFPDKINAVWDELVADAVGIYACFDSFNPDTEKLFLGIEGDRYIGGRLENYITDEEETKKQDILKALAQKISCILDRFDQVISKSKGIAPFDLAVKLEELMDKLMPL